MTRGRRAGRASGIAGLLCAVFVTTSSCSSSGHAGAAGAASPTPSASVSAYCAAFTPALAKRIVHFPSADRQETVEAYVRTPAAASSGTGPGPVGIVIDHQSQQTLCDSMPWADTFAAEGYLAVAPSLDDGSQVTETEGAIAYLRAHGATRIVLLGASMGGTTVLQAAAETQPPVQAVISVSGPETYYPADAMAAAPKLTVPVFYSAGGDDTEFAAAEQDLYAATAEKDKVLDILKGNPSHGFDLLGGLLEPINAFIKTHTG
jgi:dienelactone hydrolase